MLLDLCGCDDEKIGIACLSSMQLNTIQVNDESYSHLMYANYFYKACMRVHTCVCVCYSLLADKAEQWCQCLLLERGVWLKEIVNLKQWVDAFPSGFSAFLPMCVFMCVLSTLGQNKSKKVQECSS